MVVIRKLREPRKAKYRAPEPNVNLRKVNDIDPLNYRTTEFNYSPASYKPHGTVEERIKINPVVCDYFGCGKTLTMIEKMCGKNCLKHQGNKFDITNHLSI